MSLVPVAANTGVITEILAATYFRHVVNKAQVRRIVDVIPAIEHLGALDRGLQKLTHVSYRSVMQIGRSQPDAVQRHVGVTIRLAEVGEALVSVAGVEKVLVRRQVIGVGIKPPPRCPDILNRVNRSYPPFPLMNL